MSVVLAIITALKADSGVSTVVSTRVYRKKLSTGPTFPAITVQEISDIADADTNTGGWAHARIQCSAWAETPGQENNLSRLIRKALHRKQNTLMTAGTGKVYIVMIADAGSVPDDNPEIPLYMEHRDFLVMYDYKEV